MTLEEYEEAKRRAELAPPSHDIGRRVGEIEDEEIRELLEDAGYTIAPLRRLRLEIISGAWIILCLILVAVVLSIVRWL